MKGLINKIGESEYVKIATIAAYCFPVAAFISFLTFYFYLKSHDTALSSNSPSAERSIYPNDPNQSKVNTLKNLEKANSLQSIKTELEKYSELDSENFYPFAASLTFILEKSVNYIKSKKTLTVKKLSLLRDSFEIYEAYYDKKIFNDYRSFEHKTILDKYPKTYHTKSSINYYLHHIYLKHAFPLEQFFSLYLTVDVEDEKTFEQRLSKVLVNLENFYNADNFYSVRMADFLYTKLDALIKTSPNANYETVSKFNKKLDLVNAQFDALEDFWPMRFFYHEVHRNYTDISSLLDLNFRAELNSKSAASFMNQFFYTLTPLIILLLTCYSILSLYRWRLSEKEIVSDSYTAEKNDYLKALIFSAFFSGISFFIIPMFNRSHLDFMTKTLVLQIIFLNFMYFLPLAWMSRRLLKKCKELDINKSINVFHFFCIKQLIYIALFFWIHHFGDKNSLHMLYVVAEGTTLGLFFLYYLAGLTQKDLSKWSLSHSRLVLNFSSFSILILVTLNMILGPAAQKYFTVNDDIFYYEIKNEQIQAKAYSHFMENLHYVKKGNYEKSEKTKKSVKAFTVEILD